VSQIVTPLNEQRINNRLNSAYWRVAVVQNTGSTQDDMVRLIGEGKAVSGDVLVAEFQSAGRGRMQRKFVAEPGSALLFSSFITPREGRGSWGWLPLLSSQAVFAALQSHVGETASLSLKWPNDILLNDKKIAGLLCERLVSSVGNGVLIGIGINVSMSSEQLPTPLASSLQIEGYGAIDREDLLVSVLQKMTVYLQRWSSDDQNLVSDYRQVSSTVGTRVRVEKPGGIIIQSRAVDVEKSGSLILENGEVISVGDVIHLHADEEAR